MASGIQAEAEIVREAAFMGEPAERPPVDPWIAEFADTGVADTNLFPEIDCVRHWLAANKVTAAEQRAAAIGVGADRILLTSGALSEETYLRALGRTVGVEFEPLEDIPRAQCPIDNERLIESASAGLLPLTVGDDLYLVVAPRGIAARQILPLIGENPARALRFRFTSAERLQRFALRHTARPLPRARRINSNRNGRRFPPRHRAGAATSFRSRCLGYFCWYPHSSRQTPLCLRSKCCWPRCSSHGSACG